MLPLNSDICRYVSNTTINSFPYLVQKLEIFSFFLIFLSHKSGRVRAGEKDCKVWHT